MAGIGDDARSAWRGLRSRPGTTLFALLALAIGIGFTTSTYSVADVLLYRPLPVPDLDRVVSIRYFPVDRPSESWNVAPADFDDWRHEARGLDHLAAIRFGAANLTGSGDPERIWGARVTATFFASMGLEPVAGRVFTAAEETAGKDRVAVLGYNLWKRRFGKDPASIGSQIWLDGQAYHIIGVMPEGFPFPYGAEYWTPLVLSQEDRRQDADFTLHVVGRLRPGVSLGEADAEMRQLSRRAAAAYPRSHGRMEAQVRLLREVISGDLTSGYTRMTVVAVLFLLLIACANVSSLQLARAFARTNEIAIRAALGASRWRLIRQMLVESLTLSIAGGLLGVLVSLWCLDMERAAMPPEVQRFLPGWYRLGLNAPVLFWTLLTTLLAGVLSGLGPALWLSARAGAATLLEQTRSATANTSRQRLRSALVIAEAALAVILLTGAGLMVRGFGHMAVFPPGVRPDKTLTFTLSFPISRYQQPEQAARAQRLIADRLRALPGVVTAGFVSNVPYSENRRDTGVTLEGKPEPVGFQNLTQVQTIDEHYPDAMGLALRAGRGFTTGDDGKAPRVALASEAFLRRYFPGEDPLGHRVKLADGAWTTIVGEVEDVLHSLVDRTPQPVLYIPFEQNPGLDTAVVVRCEAPLALAPAVRNVVRDVDPLLPVAELKTFRKVVSDSITGFRYVAWMMGVLGAVALLLSSIGLYSLVAFSVQQRTREFGVRLALGARPAGLLALVLRRGALLGLGGLLLGLPVGMLLARLLQSLVFGVSPADLLVFAGLPAALLAVMLVACLAPALKATHTGPSAALRYE
jgi:putative ABC transport system permease protein